MNWFRKNYAYLCLLFLLVLALIFPIQDGDVFFYLSLGRKLFENGSLPDKDPFLYTIQDWTIYHEWLSYVLYYSAYLISGFAAVILFKTFLWLCGFLTILRTGIKSKVPSSIVVGILCIIGIACSQRFTERASLFSDVLLATVTAIFLKPELISKKSLWAMPLLFAVWVNLHPGFVLGLALWTLYVFFHGRKSPGWLWISLGFSYFACLINPQFIKGALYPFRTVFSEDWDLYRKVNPEWMPTFQMPYVATWEVACLIILALAAALLVGAIAVKKPKTSGFAIAVFIFNLYLAHNATRFVSTSALGFGLLSLFALRELNFKMTESLNNRCQALLAILCVGFGVSISFDGYAFSADKRHLGLGVDETHFPVKAAQWMLTHSTEGRIFNDYGWGSYLIWVLNRNQSLFIHSHVDDPKLLAKEYLGMSRSQEHFDQTINQYGIKYFVLERSRLTTTPPPAILVYLNKWHLIYEDSVAMIWR